jgi:hypothetical protein
MTGDEDQVHVRWLAIQQEADSLVNGQFGEGVIVVQDEDQGRGLGGDVVDQRGHQRLDRGAGARSSRRSASVPIVRLHRPQRRHEVGKEPKRIVVCPPPATATPLGRIGDG